MKLNNFTKGLSIAGRWLATALLCLSTIAFWQGAFSNAAAMASPAITLIAAKDAGDQVQEAAGETARQSKGFIRDTADRVEQTAKKNADRVEDATGGDGNFVQRKANRDAARIVKRSEEDASRTQKAVDNSKNAVEGAVDKIKDIFSR